MDFGKGVVKPKTSGHATNIFGKGVRKGKGTKAKVILEVVNDEPVWYAELYKNKEKYLINLESIKIPYDNKGTEKAPRFVWKLITLYCNAFTNPTYEAWYAKKDKSVKPKDKHHADIINRFWSTIKPNLVIYGEVKDNEFIINH